ncbi:MAG: hypothetical protein Kow0077_04570 [Anaerolineae bacterium]
MGEEHRMVIPGIQALVPDVCDFVVAIARRANLNDRAVYHCQMAVDEACTNIIEHSFNPNDLSGQIEVICLNEPDRLTIRILDNGPPFDPTRHTEPDPQMPLSEREPGGWGIYFIKKMMDTVEYALEDGRNCLTLTKYKTEDNLASPIELSPDTPMRVQRVQGDIWQITPPPRLDSNAAPALENLLDAQIEAGRVNLLVDMSQITFISTSGLKVLVNAWRNTRKHGGHLALAALRPTIREVFETVGFDQFFAIHESIPGALAEFRTRSSPPNP